MSALREWRYWRVDRRARKIAPWIARKLPARIKYYVVIDGMLTVAEPQSYSTITGMELLNLWQPVKVEEKAIA